MNKKYLIIDLGSTNIKIDQFDQKLNLEKSFKFISNLKANQTSLDIDYIHQQLETLFLDLSQNENQYFVSFAAAMHSLVATNHKNEIILTSNLLFDAQKGIETLTTTQLKEIRKINGMIIGSHLPIFRLITAQVDEISQQKIQEIFSLKSYLLKQFTGLNITDLSDASGFGLLDYRSKEWSTKLVELVGLEIKQLPKIVSNNQWFNSHFPNIYFAVGFADGVAASLFVNQINPDALSVSIGTTIGVRKLVNTLPQLKSDFEYLIPVSNTQYVYGISFSNGANNLNLFLAQQDMNFEMVESALKLEDENWDFYYPFAWKERSILLNNRSSNLDVLLKKYPPEIIAKKIVQSISFLAKWMVKNFEVMNQQILVSGGFFDNDMINQFFTDCLGQEISLIKNENLSTKGACLKLINWKEKVSLKIQTYNPKKDYQKKYSQWENVIWLSEETKWKTS